MKDKKDIILENDYLRNILQTEYKNNIDHMIAAYTLSHNKFPSLKDMIKNILLITHNDYDAMVCAIVASMIPTKKNFDVKYYGSPVDMTNNKDFIYDLIKLMAPVTVFIADISIEEELYKRLLEVKIDVPDVDIIHVDHHKPLFNFSDYVNEGLNTIDITIKSTDDKGNEMSAAHLLYDRIKELYPMNSNPRLDQLIYSVDLWDTFRWTTEDYNCDIMGLDPVGINELFKRVPRKQFISSMTDWVTTGREIDFEVDLKDQIRHDLNHIYKMEFKRAMKNGQLIKMVVPNSFDRVNPYHPDFIDNDLNKMNVFVTFSDEPSLFAHYLRQNLKYDDDEIDALMIIKYPIVSLRQFKKDINMGEIANGIKSSGGGRAAAAGFKLDSIGELGRLLNGDIEDTERTREKIKRERTLKEIIGDE